jgi:hypothetical protein
VIHEKINPRRGRRADPVAHRRLAGSRAIRPHSPGADGLPFGCRKILRRTHRQAAADERLLRANNEKLSDGCRKVVESHGG